MICSFALFTLFNLGVGLVQTIEGYLILRFLSGSSLFPFAPHHLAHTHHLVPFSAQVSADQVRCLTDLPWEETSSPSTRSDSRSLSQASDASEDQCWDRSWEGSLLSMLVSLLSSLVCWKLPKRVESQLTSIRLVLGWRWLAHTQTIFSFVMFLVSLFLVYPPTLLSTANATSLTLLRLQIPETYAPAILRSRARALAKEVGAHHITAYEAGRKMGGWAEEAVKYLVRPFMFL